MNKFKIIVPKYVEYIGRDWCNEENAYRLEEYEFPHILNKVLTGCGYTEYCLRNSQDLVLISPRKFLLENKMDQHEDDLNIYYAENKYNPSWCPESLFAYTIFKSVVIYFAISIQH